MKTDVPPITTEKHAELAKLVLALHTDYGNGLRDFQEAIHYAIFHMKVCSCKNGKKKGAIDHISLLRDLADRLRKMENLVNHA